jgi:hypothetical protein
MQLCFVSVHGPRETYFADEPRITGKPNMCVATERYQYKKVPATNTTEEQNSSSFKHKTCTLKDGQLGRNM